MTEIAKRQPISAHHARDPASMRKVQLAQHAVHVGLRRADADVEPARDLLVAASGGEKAGHFLLSLGQHTLEIDIRPLRRSAAGDPTEKSGRDLAGARLFALQNRSDVSAEILQCRIAMDVSAYPGLSPS
jgi:hypothetical protein